MLYISTRGAADGKTFADIAFEGFARDGGLYVPENYPKFTSEDLALLRGRDFPSVALEVLRRFWTQIPVPDLWGLCRDAWQPANFGNGRDPFKAHDVAPIKWLHDGVGLYELSNGPTLTFDDFSLQFLKRLHAKHLGTEPENITLLGATTGDMGASAEYAFGDRRDTRVVMLSPKDRMSKFQSAQLYSNKDENVLNLEVEGTFDDCQELAYKLLEDEEFRKANKLGAVNSYLWARIAVQVACYFYAYIQATGAQNEQVVFCVPGGNFGNAFAGYVARAMGLPILRILVATNENDAMDRFLRTGVYSPRPASETIATSSPSMDISRAANFERFLFEVLGRNGVRVKELMKDLEEKGSFELTQQEFSKVRRSGLAAGTSNHANRLEIIESLNIEYATTIDPHTADCLYTGVYLHPVGVKTICFETVQAVKFPKMTMQATGKTVPLPDAFADIFEREQRKTTVAVDESRIREAVAAFASKPWA
ncbi:threonine synthase [Sutterella seckii]|uniref:Threonine synthase n=1 Tax=Sutterella seckii TaxID=1944635 RepID=A0AAI9SF15_9BURK|nr:threonine synthase [Sutterella seckii]KAB7652945.1 threonine synthase [Sutterella seckii]